VEICARGTDDLARARDDLAGQDVRVAAIQADVCDPDQAARCVADCVDQLGGLDLLINNAYADLADGELLGSSDEGWRLTFEACLFQVVRMTRLAVPHMKARGGGTIVNVGSLSGWLPQLGGTPYGIAKSALIHMTEPLATELAAHQIRVNTVSPGSLVWSDAFWGQFRERDPDRFKAFVDATLPAGRMGTPEEAADVIAFIASPRAQWINGRHIPVDGLQQPPPHNMPTFW
jgi:NAD(P)-dependent dehydrogenase (short-subunit alcohol dehydrogenase family)